jgi:hypothetical protein
MEGFSIFRSTVVHCKKQPYDVYIGRPSKWGNPFTDRKSRHAEFKVGSVQEAIEKYEEWIQTQPDLMASLHELKGKTLGCWCVVRKPFVTADDDPFVCHGQVLARLADAT